MPKKRVSLQAKHLRQSRKRQLHNNAITSEIKTAVRKAKAAISSAAAEATPLIRAAGRTLDKAATKKILHPRTAARYKSRLAKQMNTASKPSA